MKKAKIESWMGQAAQDILTAIESDNDLRWLTVENEDDIAAIIAKAYAEKAEQP